MINGIDILFVAIALVLILIVWEGWDRYKNWSEWDRDRRHERKHYRYEFQDALDEAQYRIHLRADASSFVAAVQRVTRSMEKLNEAFRGSVRW